MACSNGQPSPTESLVHRMQTLARNADHDQESRATLLQLSRQLTASLEAPDEVVSHVAFSVS